MDHHDRINCLDLIYSHKQMSVPLGEHAEQLDKYREHYSHCLDSRHLTVGERLHSVRDYPPIQKLLGRLSNPKPFYSIIQVSI